MKETYLHYLWKTKSIFFKNVRLITGETFELLDPGSYNTESGPDFFNGAVKIDHINWNGNIELHVKSSDWYLHNHHTDPAYQQVVLHVVYHYDKPVMVNGRALPTLELKPYVSAKHLQQFNTVNVLPNKIICGALINNIDPIYLENMKEKNILSRLNRKTAYLLEPPYLHFSHFEIIYTLLLKSFGRKVNDEPMKQLALTVPYKLLHVNPSSTYHSFLFGASQLGNRDADFNEPEWNYLKHKYNLHTLSTFQWKFKGLRPSSFPPFMMRRLHWWLLNVAIEELMKQAESNNLGFFIQLLKTAPKDLKINLQLIESVIINCIIPYLWWKGIVLEKDDYKERALDWYQAISPEQNNVISKWKKFNVPIKNAYDSQALLEIYSDFCSASKCLECSVGTKILKN